MGKARRLRDAFESPDAKLAYNRELFSTIAARYDFITRVLSYGQDARWKRRVVEIVRADPSTRTETSRSGQARALDLACGTGDIAWSLARTHSVVGLDLTHAMLSLARRRTATSGARGAAVGWVAGDMTHLPFPSGSFDVVTTSYGLRNVPRLDQALAEIARVLRPHGLFVSLDFNKPDSALVRAIYLGYLTAVGGLLGLVLHGSSETYRYIPHSIRRYPGAHGVARLMKEAGFADVRIEPKLGGLMTIHIARKEGRPEL